jgi:hypothetical protein
VSAVLSGLRLSVQTECAEDSALSSAGMFELAGESRIVSLRSRNAGVAELADALDSKSSDRKIVWVRAPPPAIFFSERWALDVGRSTFDRRGRICVPPRRETALRHFQDWSNVPS